MNTKERIAKKCLERLVIMADVKISSGKEKEAILIVADAITEYTKNQVKTKLIEDLMIGKTKNVK